MADPALPDPLTLLGNGSRELMWMCRQLAGDLGSAERERLYYDTDLVVVFELYAERKAERILERKAHNAEVIRSATMQ